MPINFFRDADVVHTSVTGEVDEDELFDHALRLAAEFANDPFRAELVDLCEVTHVEISGETLRKVKDVWTQAEVPAVRAQVAFIAPSDDMFRLARMYQVLREGGYVEIRVFRDVYSARNWLDLREKENGDG